MSETMDNLHIPPEVIEAGAKAIFETWCDYRGVKSGNTWEELLEVTETLGVDEAPKAHDMMTLARIESEKVVRAQIAAWLECGMAREGSARLNNKGIDWFAHTFTDNDNPSDFPAIIIRTKEAT